MSVKASQEVISNLINIPPEQLLPMGGAAEFVLNAPEGSVLALGGMDSESLRQLLDEVEPAPNRRRVLFTRLEARPTTESIVEQVIDLLAETARRLWPLWFTDVSFAECRSDTLGRLAAGVIAHKAAEEIAGLSSSWAEAAARLVLDDRRPRVSGVFAALELTQLSLTISRTGLVLLADVTAVAQKGSNPATFVHALEWIAQHSRAAVIALFPVLPANKPPFDRILYGAQRVIAEVGREGVAIEPSAIKTTEAGPWIAPWRGLPHPLSDVEQRLAKALAGDTELAPLFSFNQFVETARGSRPKVDLVWSDGRLVVELDGYPDHTTLRKFMDDRHRDYELMLSGYTVLRLANDEIAQDTERAIEKIRDLVKLCRTRAVLEG